MPRRSAACQPPRNPPHLWQRISMSDQCSTAVHHHNGEHCDAGYCVPSEVQYAVRGTSVSRLEAWLGEQRNIVRAGVLCPRNQLGVRLSDMTSGGEGLAVSDKCLCSPAEASMNPRVYRTPSRPQRSTPATPVPADATNSAAQPIACTQANHSALEILHLTQHGSTIDGRNLFE